MTKKWVLILLVVVLLVSLCEQKKKKKKDKKSKDFNPLDLRPQSVKPELYCDACIAIIKEATKQLRGKKRESEVFDYMADVCNPEKYYVYNHPPPDMRTGCEAFLNGWEEEIEKALINRVDDETPIQNLCFEITKACLNVDPKNVPRFDDQIMVDGQPKKINKDGKLQEEDEDL